MPQTKATGAVFHSWKPRWKRHLEGSGGETTEALFISVKGRFSGGREVLWAVQGGPVLRANIDLGAGGSSQGILSRPKHSTGARHIQGIQALQTAVSPSQEFQDTKSSGGRHGKPNGTRLCQLQGMLKASCCSGTQTLDEVRPKSSTLPAFPRSPLKLGNGLSSFTRAKGARGGETTQHNRS